MNIFEYFRKKRENPYVERPLRPEIAKYVKGDVALATMLQMARRRKTDLVEAEYTEPASAKQAIYRGRVYSISGTHPRFPALPEEMLKEEMLMYPFVDGLTKPRRCPAREIEVYSNRPWVDDRTEEEVAAYEKIFEIRARRDYKWIREHLPEMAPADYEKYAEMKRGKTEEYQKLWDAAAKARDEQE